jgi:hypothetical protein
MENRVNKEKEGYKITYSNSFEFSGRLLAFRKKELFDITEMPRCIPFNNHWNVGRVQLSKSKAKELLTGKEVKKDVTDLSWYIQEALNHVLTEYL